MSVKKFTPFITRGTVRVKSKQTVICFHKLTANAITFRI